MSSKARTLVKGSILRIIEFFANAVVGLMMMPFIIHSLGDKMYGLWIFVGTFLGYFGLMDFGLNSAVQRFISRAIGTEDHQDISKTVNTALLIFSAIGLVALMITVAISFFLPVCIKNITDVTLFRKVLFILGLNFAFGFPLRVFSGILTADLRYDISTSIELFKLVVRTTLIIIFLKNGYGIMALAVITFVLDIGGYAAKAIFVKRLYRYIIYSLSLFDKAKVKNLFGYSVYTFITQIADTLRFNIDNLVIVYFMGLNFVTLYSIASRLMKYFIDFAWSAVGFMMPVFSQYEAKKDYYSIREKFILMTKISSYLSISIGGILITFGRAFIERWMGKEYLGAFPILIILCIAVISDLMIIPTVNLVYGISKHKYLTISNIIEGIVNLFLSIFLVKKYGLIGVALGTMVPMLVIKILVQPIYVCRFINLDLRKYYLGLIFPILLKSLIGLSILFLIFSNFILPNYMRLAILVFANLILFIPFIFITGFNKSEKELLKKALFK